ncbi:MAG: hypothetical protein ABI615_01925 [Chthoniobacterales bacterium]
MNTSFDPFPRCTMVVCSQCGNARMFVQSKQLEILPTAPGWSKAESKDIRPSSQGG